MAGLSEKEVNDTPEVIFFYLSLSMLTITIKVLDHLRFGNRNRKTEPTAANKVSSRSHAVLQVIAKRMCEKTGGLLRESKLSCIDLAGSERASASANRGARLREGANINRSLLALANCINALSRKAEKNMNVNYRDSKLTHLLRTSLEGPCRVVMIANINPSHLCYEDSHNTLKYANRAKNIRVQITENPIRKATEGSLKLGTPRRNNYLGSDLKLEEASFSSSAANLNETIIYEDEPGVVRPPRKRTANETGLRGKRSRKSVLDKSSVEKIVSAGASSEVQKQVKQMMQEFDRMKTKLEAVVEERNEDKKRIRRLEKTVNVMSSRIKGLEEKLDGSQMSVEPSNGVHQNLREESVTMSDAPSYTTANRDIFKLHEENGKRKVEKKQQIYPSKSMDDSINDSFASALEEVEEEKNKAMKIETSPILRDVTNIGRASLRSATKKNRVTRLQRIDQPIPFQEMAL